MVTLVVPFYNETNRIERFKNGLLQYQNRNALIKELIFINDGSTDETANLLNSLKINYHKIPISIITVAENKGKGNAIKLGVATANQTWVLCNDADLSYTMEQLDEWYEQHKIDFTLQDTVYFGKRILNDKKSKFFLHRIIIGKIFYYLIRLILGIKITDTQCGFKLYKTSIAKEVFKNLHEKKFAFDLEIIYKLQIKQYKIISLPVRCYDVQGSKVNLLSDSINMFLALFRIRKY